MVDTVISVAGKLEQLKLGPSPQEAKALLNWLRNRGLEQVKPGLVAFLSTDEKLRWEEEKLAQRSLEEKALADCLDGVHFLAKYEFVNCVGQGVRGTVVRVRNRETSGIYAAKIYCLPHTPREYLVAQRITQNKELLRNVTTLYDCALVDKAALMQVWPKCEYEPHACEDIYMVMVTDFVDITLEELLPDEVQPYHLFELWYTFMQLLTVGILPEDVHEGNVGLIHVGSSVTYTLCDCTVTFPPGLHVRLIDYGEYKLEGPRDVYTIPSSEVARRLRGVFEQRDAMDDELYLFYRALLTPTEASAVAVLADVTSHLLPCTDEGKGICPEEPLSRETLWGPYIIRYTENLQTLTETSLEVVRPYLTNALGIDSKTSAAIFTLDYLRSVVGGKIEGAEETFTAILPLKQQLYYTSLQQRLALVVVGEGGAEILEQLFDLLVTKPLPAAELLQMVEANYPPFFRDLLPPIRFPPEY